MSLALDPRLAVFEQHRGLLRGLAYRMLGSIADADDVVQETFLRWGRVDPATITSARAWLVTACTRLAIDERRSAWRRRRTYVGPWLPEPLVDEAPPSELAELNESLTTAFLVVLERLGASERAAFVLHEVLGFSHAEIAGVLGRSELASRQLVSRARRRLAGERREAAAPAPEHEASATAFFAAMRAGDVAALVALLAGDAECRSDGGGKVVAARRVVRGALRVARLLAGVARKQPPDVRWTAARVNHRPGIVLTRGGTVLATVSVDWDARGRIAQVFTVRNPDKLRDVAGRAGALHSGATKEVRHGLRIVHDALSSPRARPVRRPPVGSPDAALGR
ncbi:MAG TPA: RNA polymerase sigma factor SigJ [Candidatus Acidoferrum sp.]|jgi:RNA polymerase sigma-70 factor (ECF subfamily)|nr:RNA polymerase sigma factor SigJ [Candidatus Acidoferrum sp.]